MIFHIYEKSNYLLFVTFNSDEILQKAYFHKLKLDYS